MRVRIAGLIATILLGASLMPSGAQAFLPKLDWIPNTAGMIPFPVKAPGGVAWVNTTRRIVAQPQLPVRLVAGHALFGLYESAGAGWATLTPNCLGLVRLRNVERLLGMLDSCGVEGIAFDPQDPLGLYVSAYNFTLNVNANTGAILPGPVEYGGVYRSQLPFGPQIGTAGLTWHKVLDGIRGNALAIRRPSRSAPATLIVGRIQAGNGVGTDSNSFCAALISSRADACTPSVYVSTNNGDTWTPKYFEPAPSGCPDGVVIKSSRLVGNLQFDGIDNNVVYAGANSGLWVSTDSGGTWSLKLASCGGSPAVALTQDKLGTGTRRVYVGDSAGKLYVATTSGTGPGTFTPIALDASVKGQILSVISDSRDKAERTLFVASWAGTGGVYKITVDPGYTSGHVVDLKASFLDPFKPLLSQISLPYPLLFDPLWRPSLFLMQHPVLPDLLYASTVLGGIWVRSDG